MHAALPFAWTTLTLFTLDADDPRPPLLAITVAIAGPLAANALLLGKQAGLTSRDLTLTTGEVFNQVQVKAGS
jgi:hypothetical protein